MIQPAKMGISILQILASPFFIRVLVDKKDTQ